MVGRPNSFPFGAFTVGLFSGANVNVIFSECIQKIDVGSVLEHQQKIEENHA